MGCGCSGGRIERGTLHCTLEIKIKTCDMPELDDIYAKVNPISEFVEGVRSVLIDNLDEVIIASGACAHKEPSLGTCILGLLYGSAVNVGGYSKLAVKIIVSDSGIDFQMACKEPNLLKVIESFKKYFIGFLELGPKATQLADYCKDLATIPAELESAFDVVKEKLSSEPFKIIAVASSMKHGISTVKELIQVIPKVIDALTKYMLSLKDLVALMSKPEFITKMEENTKLAIKEKRTDNTEILYHCLLPEERCKHGPKPAVHEWRERMKDKCEMKKKGE